MTGGKGAPQTGLLKISVGYGDGFVGEGQISYAGPNGVARARIAIDIVRESLALTGVRKTEIRYDLDRRQLPARRGADAGRRPR